MSIIKNVKSLLIRFTDGEIDPENEYYDTLKEQLIKDIGLLSEEDYSLLQRDLVSSKIDLPERERVIEGIEALRRGPLK